MKDKNKSATHKHRGQAAVRVLGTGGLIFVDALTKPQRSLVAHHWNAVRRYLERGDETGLDALRGRRVGRGLGAVELECDPDVIEHEALINEVSFESIYDEVV